MPAPCSHRWAATRAKRRWYWVSIAKRFTASSASRNQTERRDARRSFQDGLDARGAGAGQVGHARLVDLLRTGAGGPGAEPSALSLPVLKKSLLSGFEAFASS